MKNTLIKRRLLSEVLKFLPRREMFAIVGPRQAGKTTLLHLIADYLKTEKGVGEGRIFYFSFEDPLIQEEFESNPQEFIAGRMKRETTYFFLDEFHYVKEGGRKLKLVYDLFPKAKIIVSGSSSLELTFTTAEHLVGRIFYFRLLPLDFGEFLEYKNPDLLSSFSERWEWKEDFLTGKVAAPPPPPSIFDKRVGKLWEELVTFGGYPEVVKTEDKETKVKILENIVSTYLQREIRTLLLVEDLNGYQNLLKILAAQSGKLLNLNQFSDDTGLNFLLLKKYLKVLEETFIIKRLAPFHRNLSSELRKTPKGYFLDNGLRNLLLNNFSSLMNRPDKGEVGEAFVFQEIFKKLKPNERINFWRTRGGAEVDFVFTRGQTETPLEVKVKSFGEPKITRSLSSFLSSYGPKRAVVFNQNLWQIAVRDRVEILFSPLWYA